MERGEGGNGWEMLTRLIRLRGGDENSSGAMAEGEGVAMLLPAVGLCCVWGGRQEGGCEAHGEGPGPLRVQRQEQQVPHLHGRRVVPQAGRLSPPSFLSVLSPARV
jgi:hypothetical protein